MNLDNLFELYKIYCLLAVRVRDFSADSAPDFLGWLKGRKDEPDGWITPYEERIKELLK